MTEGWASTRTTRVQLHSCDDGSGKVIISLPQDIVRELDLNVGDSLSVELIDGSVVLKPVRNDIQQPASHCDQRRRDQSHQDQMFSICRRLPTSCWSRAHFCFLIRYEEIISITIDLLGRRDAAQRWLDSPARGLGGQLPYELLRTYPGYIRVRDLLMRIIHGFCA